jgi:hypothetical protein
VFAVSDALLPLRAFEVDKVSVSTGGSWRLSVAGRLAMVKGAVISPKEEHQYDIRNNQCLKYWLSRQKNIHQLTMNSMKSERLSSDAAVPSAKRAIERACRHP